MTLTSLTEIVEVLKAEYNRYISIYQYDDHARLTNGSAGHFIDISLDNNAQDEPVIRLSGKRYRQDIEKTCQATENALLTTLKQTI